MNGKEDDRHGRERKNENQLSNSSKPGSNCNTSTSPKHLKSILKNKATRDRRRSLRSPSPVANKQPFMSSSPSVIANTSSTSSKGFGRHIDLLGLTPKDECSSSTSSPVHSSKHFVEVNDDVDDSSHPENSTATTVAANITVRSEAEDNIKTGVDEGCTADIYDDDLICLDTHNKIDVSSLQGDIDNIVHNMMDEGVALDCITTKLVARRLNNLYQRDFLNSEARPEEDDLLQPKNFLSTVESFLRVTKLGVNSEKAQSVIQSSVMVAPGVRQYDMNTLDHGEWLNDVIVNYYMSMLVRERPDWIAISSFFLEEIQRANRLGHKRQASCLPVSWLGGSNHLLIPMCVESHWSLLYCSIKEKRFVVYNSLEPSENDRKSVMMCAQYIKREQETAQKCKSKWTIAYKEEVAIQKNHSDCGVYTCMFARMLIFQLGINLKLEYVSEFRRWMQREIEQDSLMS